MGNKQNLNASARSRRYRRWKKQLAAIEKDVTGLVIYRHVYKEVGKIIRENPKLHIPSSFYDWIHQSYAQVMVIGIGRLVDFEKHRQRQRVISFIRLMREIREHPNVLSRRRFEAMYQKSMNPIVRSWGRRDFKKFSIPKGGRVDLRIIYNQERKLMTDVRRIQRFRHKHIAHKDQNSLKSLPTHEDIDKCIANLSNLLKFYKLLLEGSAPHDVLPTWQYDWTEIFHTPWIEKEPDAHTT